MAATKRDEDRELSNDISQILQAAQAWDVPDDFLSEMRSPNLDVNEPPIGEDAGVRASAEGQLEESGASDAQQTEPFNDEVDPYDEWE